jgi:protein TonB
MVGRLSGLASTASAVVLTGCISLMGAATTPPTVSAVDPPSLGLDLEAAMLEPLPDPPPPPPEKLPPPPKPKPITAVRPPPEVTFEQLIGLKLEEATSVLGTPNLRTERPPAKVLAYHGKTCTLSVFFYLDLKTDEYRALAYEVKGDDQSEPAKQRCLTEIVSDGSV